MRWWLNSPHVSPKMARAAAIKSGALNTVVLAICVGWAFLIYLVSIIAILGLEIGFVRE